MSNQFTNLPSESEITPLTQMSTPDFTTEFAEDAYLDASWEDRHELDYSGAGSGEDDLQDYNDREADDYLNE